MRRHIETVSNVIVIVVGIVVLYTIGIRYLHTGALPEALKPGARLPDAQQAEIRDTPFTLLIFLRKGCHFCDESLPFYQRLGSALSSSGKKVKLLVLFPNSDADDARILKEGGAEVAYSADVDFNRFNVSGTPTLIFVDRTGTIQNSWVGKIPVERERAVIATIVSTAGQGLKAIN